MDAYFNYRAQSKMELIPLLPIQRPKVPQARQFHHFSKLPQRIRRRIFHFAAPAPRTHFLEIYNYHTYNIAPNIRYIPPLPPLFHTCQDSRAVSMGMSGGDLIYFSDDPPTTSFYFNFDRDILFLSSRFAPDKTAAETFKLRELSTLMPASTISRIRRLVVTYSGLDSYEHIGPLFRSFVSLEVCYLAMTDWWSSRTVNRRLRKGVPKLGVEAARIQEMIERSEAEETSDEDEEEDEKEMRMKLRLGRRIVEVELRLDE